MESAPSLLMSSPLPRTQGIRQEEALNAKENREAGGVTCELLETIVKGNHR